MKTSSKALVCSLLLMMVVMSLIIIMSHFRFQTTLTQLIHSKLTVISENIADSVEGAIDLGLSLSELQNTNMLIARGKKSDSQINTIDIFTPNGEIMFSTAPQHIGKNIISDVLAAQSRSTERTWGMDSETEFTSGMTLTDSIGQSIGGVVLTYSKTRFSKKVSDLTASLILNACIATTLFVGLVYFGIRLGFRDLDQYMERVNDAMKSVSAEPSEVNITPQLYSLADTLPDPGVIQQKIKASAHQMAQAYIQIKSIDRGDEEAGEIHLKNKAGKKPAITMTITESGYGHRLTQRLIIFLSIIMVLSSMTVAGLALRDFNRLLTPELGYKARMIGRTVEADLIRALGYGIPFDQMYGADSYLKGVVNDHNELTYMAITRSDGTLLYQGGVIDDNTRSSLENSSSTITHKGVDEVREVGNTLDHIIPIKTVADTIGSVHVGIDGQFVQRQLDDIFFDIVVILLSAVLVTFEIMLALVLMYGTAPIQQLNLLLDRLSQGDFSHVIVIRTRCAISRTANRLARDTQALHKAYRSACFRAGDATASKRLSEISPRLHDAGARFGLSISGPLTLRQAVPSDIRLPLFLFAFAEELQKSFLPLFVSELYTPVSWLNEPIIISLPITVYLAVLAVAAPFSGGWAERYGCRRLFIAGLIPSVVGFIGCSLASSITELVLWRGVTALGYAMITIGCQDYVIANSNAHRWGRNMVLFIGIIMSATMCGTAIGGILADRLGYHKVFVLAAMVALLAGIIAAYSLTDKPHSRVDLKLSPTRHQGPHHKRRLGATLSVLSNVRFLLFLLCIAIPANVLIAAYLWYLVPLYLSDLGASASEIARVIMLYYLLIIIIGPITTRMADRSESLALCVGLGSFLSSAGLIIFNDWQSTWAVVISVTIIGLTHALTKGAQIPLALTICSAEIDAVGRTTVLGFLRFFERIGSVLGILVSAMIIAHYGYAASIGITGALVSGAALLFIVIHLADNKKRAIAPLGEQQ